MLHGILTHRRVSVCCPRVQLIAPDPAEIRLLRGHKLSVTCLVITPDEKHIFSASKDCSIIKCNYDLKLFKKKKRFLVFQALTLLMSRAASLLPGLAEPPF